MARHPLGARRSDPRRQLAAATLCIGRTQAYHAESAGPRSRRRRLRGLRHVSSHVLSRRAARARITRYRHVTALFCRPPKH